MEYSLITNQSNEYVPRDVQRSHYKQKKTNIIV